MKNRKIWSCICTSVLSVTLVQGAVGATLIANYPGTQVPLDDPNVTNGQTAVHDYKVTVTTGSPQDIAMQNVYVQMINMDTPRMGQHKVEVIFDPVGAPPAITMQLFDSINPGALANGTNVDLTGMGVWKWYDAAPGNLWNIVGLIETNPVPQTWPLNNGPANGSYSPLDNAGNPITPFAALTSLSSAGDWTLRFTDYIDGDNSAMNFDSVQIYGDAVVPEPSTIGLVVVGTAMLLVKRKAKQQKV